MWKPNSVNTRTEWELFWMTQAFFYASQRGLDQRTLHGCVVVSKDNRLLSAGFNGPVRGFDDQWFIDHQEYKYDAVVHAEANAIDNFCGDKSSLANSTAYVTGMPCIECLKKLIQNKIHSVVYGPVSSACMEKEKDLIRSKIKESCQVKLTETRFSLGEIAESLNKTKNYIQHIIDRDANA